MHTHTCIHTSVQFSCSVVSDSLWPHGSQPTRLPCPSPILKDYSNSCPLNQWCQPTISSSVIPFSSHLQSLSASVSFPMNEFFASGGQNIESSASVLPIFSTNWFPLGLTDLISLLFKGISWVFSNKTVQKHQFFSDQLFLWFNFNIRIVQFISVQSLSHVQLFATAWTAALRPPWPSPTHRVYPNSCQLSRWCHPVISSFVIPFSYCLQSFPTSGSFQMSQYFASGGRRLGVSATTSVLPMNTQDWSPLGWTGWISLQSKGVSRVFSNTTVQKHQFFSAQHSL